MPKKIKTLNDEPMVPAVPLYDYILITANTMKEQKTAGGIIIPESSQKAMYLPNQTVVSKGMNADQVEVGDEIVLKIDNFLRPTRKPKGTEIIQDTMEYVLPIELIGNVEYMYIGQRDIKYILPK